MQRVQPILLATTAANYKIGLYPFLSLPRITQKRQFVSKEDWNLQWKDSVSLTL